MSSDSKSTAMIVRIALFVVLGVAVIAMIVDFRARMNAKAALGKVDALIAAVDVSPPPEESALSNFSPEAVQKLIGRAPDAPGSVDGDVLVESYSWRGAFKHFRVFVKYLGDPPLVDGVTNADPPVWN